MYAVAKQLLFKLPPEWAHKLVLTGLKYYSKYLPAPTHNILPWYQPKRLMGLEFPNPVGLAAGLDKSGDYIHALSTLGFGFIEVGTVTPLAQAGNPHPRLFRLLEDKALINRMGFNNPGLEVLLEKLHKVQIKQPLGINIGKNKQTNNKDALQDYGHCYRSVYPYADYVMVNISSPNTPGLRELQYTDHLADLLGPLKQLQERMSHKTGRYVPLLVKFAPELTPDEIVKVAGIVKCLAIDGIAATNTSLRRPKLYSEYQTESGGLSGQPIADISNEVIKQFRAELGADCPIIGIGGIMNPEDAQAKFRAGADLIQLYTGLIYTGPGLIKDCLAASQKI